MSDTSLVDSIVYVGCFTCTHQADPFYDDRQKTGFPHDTTKVGAGIMTLKVHAEGKLSALSPQPVVPASVVKNPSYLAVQPKGPACSSAVVYVVSEEQEGRLFVFDIKSGEPTSLQQVGPPLSTRGSAPCHITILNEKDDYALVSNYGGNEVGAALTVFRRGNREVVEVGSKFSPPRAGSDRASFSRQVGSHVHCSCKFPGAHDRNKISPSDGLVDVLLDVLIADLGADAIVRYHVNPQVGNIVEKGRLALPLGSGPRSISFNPNPAFPHVGVVSLEMAAQVQLFYCREHDSCLQTIGKPLSTIPSDWPQAEDPIIRFNQGRWVSDVVWSKNGRYLFAASRLHQSISIFRIVLAQPTCPETATLKFLHRVSSGGQTPRCLEVTPSGKFLLVAHHHSHDVTLFSIDEEAGLLTLIDQIEVPLASCVKAVSPDSI